jgi:addiction module HigA family antidote
MKNYKEPSKGILTNRMDVNTPEFDEFQAILLNKSKNQTEYQKREIELLAIKFKMEDYLVSEDSEVKLAGEFLKSFLKTTHIRQNKFADYIGLKPSNLNKVIGGERPISYEIAIILGRIFSTEPMIWLNIQAKNEFKKIVQSKQSKYNRYSLDDLV